MIRINLLDIRRKKRRRIIIPVPVLAMVLLLITASVGSYYFYTQQTERINHLNGIRGNNDKKIKNLKNKVKEVTRFEKLIATIEKNQEIILNLRSHQSAPVRVMDEISQVLPENTWINSMEIKNDRVTITGTAFTNTDVVHFVNNLKGAQLFNDVYLEQSKSKSAPPGIDIIYDFKVLIRVNLKT